MTTTIDLPKEIWSDLAYFKKTGKPRCHFCKKDFKKESKYTWMPTCECVPDIRISIG